MKIAFFITALATLLVFFGCGYKPSSGFTKKALGVKIFTEVAIPIDNPESSILIKDIINEAIITKYGSRLSSKNEADATITIKKANFSIDGLQKDEYGFTVFYRSSATLDVEVQTRDKKNSFTVSGTYDFFVTSESIISEEKRLDSFKFATIKALDEIGAKLSSIK